MRRALLILSAALSVACSSRFREPWHPGQPLDKACLAATTEADFDLLTEQLSGWLDGELQLHALAPSAMEELTNAPIVRNPTALIWSYRFSPAAPRPGHGPTPPIGHDGYPVSVDKVTGSFVRLRVITADRILQTEGPQSTAMTHDVLVDGTFYPARLDYHGPLFSHDPALSEYADPDRRRGFGMLQPVPEVGAPGPRGPDRVEVTVSVALPGYQEPTWQGNRRGSCEATAEAVLPLPPGPTLWDRLNLAFLAGPIRLHGTERGVAPVPLVTPPASPDVNDEACASGQSEACYQAASDRLRSTLPSSVLAPLPSPATPAASGAPPVEATASPPPSPGSLASARALLKRGCELGHGPACGSLAALLDAGPSPDHAGSQQAAQRACELDFGDGCAMVASESLARGDEGRAQKQFLLACRLGSARGCLAEGRQAERSVHNEQALRAYQKSCVYGMPLGCERYAWLGQRIPSVEPRLVQEGYKLACGARSAWGCNALGVSLSNPAKPALGGSSGEIADAFTRACSLGDRAGCFNRDAAASGRPLRPLRPPADPSPASSP